MCYNNNDILSGGRESRCIPDRNQHGRGCRMGLFDFLSGDKAKKKRTAISEESMMDYSGMRLEVMDENSTLLFVARLSISDYGDVQLYQITDYAMPLPENGDGAEDAAITIPVLMRGYFELEKTALHMQGDITPISDGLWKVERFRVTGRENDRGFFRQGTNNVGTLHPIGSSSGVEMACDVVNISASGVCFRTMEEFEVGDRLQLRSKLLLDQPALVVNCEVCRISGGRKDEFEYGCKFIDLNQTMQDDLARVIVDLQREKLKR